MGWQISKRLRDEYSEPVLHEGIPDWMWSGLLRWVEDRLTGAYGMSDERLQMVERRLRTQLDWARGLNSAWRSLRDQMSSDPELALDLLSLLVASQHGYRDRQNLEVLNGVLGTAGSAWHVRLNENGTGQFERRIGQEQVERFQVISAEGRHGQHLRTAWTKLYGRDPEASTAYSEAVKAVESAGAQVISPDNDQTTLGQMISHFRDKPSKWLVPFGESPEQGQTVLLEMMKAVWHGQYDRHGTPDAARPSSVSVPEAEAALHTAITLVHMFASGLVSRAE